MDRDRRDFLKVAGLSALALGAAPHLACAAGDAPGEAIPSPKALTAKRWGMIVDVKKCATAGSDGKCIDCVAACHIVHNVPAIESKQHEIKWIWQTGLENAFPGEENRFLDDYIKETLKNTPITVLCNHCDNPPCVRVCPVKATFRRSDGVVMQDQHRCIGCRFCMAACPYGARSLNWFNPRPKIGQVNKEYPTRTRGVVEKCTLCFARLSVGQIPACVEACKEKALIFGDVEDPTSEIRQVLRTQPTIRRKPHLGTRPQVYYIL